ncbi:hypothetical protein PGQ11_007520 [Apiospora arundinis]|uniref:DUF7580 domain-containing protein n=1 Tax=Apiospora arundinis TaxID=335852 RepID=A0ABR2IVX2_9PEZI
MATGIEIVGVILGTIPLMIEGIKIYRNVCDKSSRSRVKRALDTLATEIQAEETILCEAYHILRDEAEIDWIENEQIEKKVELHHEGFSVAFSDTAKAMQTTIEELKKKLGMDPDGKILDPSTVVRFKLMWVNSEIDGLMRSLRLNNERLMAMVNIARNSVILEPRSQRTREANLIGVVRHMLNNACSALSGAMKCECQGSHVMNLRVEPYSQLLPRNSAVEELGEKMRIHVVVMFGMLVHHQSQQLWYSEEISLKKNKPESIPRKIFAPSPPTPGETHAAKATGKATTITRALKRLSGKKQKKPDNEASTELEAVHGGNRPVEDICGVLSQKQCMPIVDCYGYIVDASAPEPVEFSIQPSGNPQITWSVLTLRDVLKGHGSELPRLKYGHKMKLAALVARALLQLSASSWLPEIMTSENMVILKSGDDTIYDSIYVSQSITKAPSIQLNLPSYYNRHEQMVLALGIMLIELMLGVPWEEIRTSANNPSQEGSASDQGLAQEKLRELRDVNLNCFSAAKYCVNVEILETRGDLESHALRREIYENVVGPLEDNLNSRQRD